MKPCWKAKALSFNWLSGVASEIKKGYLPVQALSAAPSTTLLISLLSFSGQNHCRSLKSSSYQYHHDPPRYYRPPRDTDGIGLGEIRYETYGGRVLP